MKVSNALFDIKLGGITGNFKFLFREILKKQICIKAPIQWKLELYCQFIIISLFVFISGVFIARGKEDALVTKNLVPGNTVYGEKKIQVEVWFICCKICINN